MNSRRGSTTSPISLEKISSASSSSPTFTCISVRTSRFERGLPELLRVHLAQAFVALHGNALAAGGEDGIQQAAAGRSTGVSAPLRFKLAGVP